MTRRLSDSSGTSGTGPGAPGSRKLQGIQSIEVGGRILEALADAGGPASLTAIAEAAGLPSSNARRYLISLARIGLVAQAESDGRYALGPLALRLGLAALDTIDVAEAGSQVVADLSEALNLTVSLIVWGEGGPTVVRYRQSRHMVAIHVRLGAVVPLLTSAAGRIFLAHLPEAETASVLKAAPDRSEAGPWADAKSRAPLMEEIRAAGFAYVDGAVAPGLRAVAAPAFDADGRICGVLVVYGSAEAVDVSPTGPVVTALKAAAGSLSARMGRQ